MKNVVIASVVLLGLTTPSYAWYPAPLPVQVKQPIQMAQAGPGPYSAPAPTRRGRPIPLAGPYSPMPMTGGCGVIPCGYGGVAGGVVGPGVGYGMGIPAYIYDSGIGMPAFY